MFRCMLALHAEGHMCRNLSLIQFEDDVLGGTRAQRCSPVAPAGVLKSTRKTVDIWRTPDELRIHSFAALLADVATLTLNAAMVPDRPDHVFPVFAQATVQLTHDAVSNAKTGH